MKYHHIGIVVKSITEYEKTMIFQEKLRQIFDPIQNANLALYSNFSDSYIELIEPTAAESFTYNFLTNNTSPYHHVCYEIDSEDRMNSIAKNLRLLKFKGPIPAALFNGKFVYFYFSRNKQIIEFILN